MSLDTFANLKTSIADHLDRDDLTSHIPDFITLAESRHKRDIRIREMITRSNLTVNARQISLPSGFLEPITFRLTTTPLTVLQYVNYHEMNRNYDNTTGKPSLFTISGEIEFDKSPDTFYTGEMVYYKAETALSDSNTSNNILAVAPDAYLYAALAAAAPFLMDDPRIPVWNSFYKNAVDGLNELNKTRHSGPLVSRPAGATP